MKVVVNLAPDIEEILMDSLTEHLVNEVGFAKLFPNFGDVSITTTHPFAYLVNKQINPTFVVPKGLFPSITLVNETDNKNPEIQTQTLLRDAEVKLPEIQDIRDHRSLYIISDESLNLLENAVRALPAAEYLPAQGVQNFRRSNFCFEIWSENQKVKNALYDITELFLEGKKRFTIMEDNDIVIVEGSISGNKTGFYNMDFGKILHGGMIRLNIDFSISQYIVDTDLEILREVEHYEENINRT